MRNTFGNLFTLTTFGESHGIAVGGVIDGFPAGIEIDMDFIQSELNRRRPGQSHITTARKEADKVEFLSGVSEGKSTGTPIGFEVRNQNQHSQDYEEHALSLPPFSRRFHLSREVWRTRLSWRRPFFSPHHHCPMRRRALAKLALRQLGISITAYTSQVGSIALEKDYHLYDLNTIEDNPVRCPDQRKAKEMEDLIAQVKADGDTIGGIITCVIKGCPVGLGEPEFGKLHAQLGAAMLGINAVKGFEYGEGFAGVTARGSEQNDVFIPKADAAETPADAAVNQDIAARITTKSNHSGGIQGGLSNGQDIYFRVAFKPIATLLMEQNTVDLEGNATMLTARGRHDPCVLPRAVPVVEAMAAMVILDNYLLNKTIKL